MNTDTINNFILADNIYDDYKKEQSRMKWDLKWLDMCDWIGKNLSKDPSTKLGSVIVDNLKRPISIGYNGFPREIEDKKEWYDDRDIKYQLVCHAERNALDNAPCDVRGMTLYLTQHPCKECQKSIIQKGIKRVVWYKSSDDFMKRWGQPNSFPFPLELAGIEMMEYDRFNEN